MRITKVETMYVEIPCEVPQGVSSGDITGSTDALCRITTDEGIQGIGEGRGGIAAGGLPNYCRGIHPAIDRRKPPGESISMG